MSETDIVFNCLCGATLLVGDSRLASHFIPCPTCKRAVQVPKQSTVKSINGQYQIVREVLETMVLFGTKASEFHQAQWKTRGQDADLLKTYVVADDAEMLHQLLHGRPDKIWFIQYYDALSPGVNDDLVSESISYAVQRFRLTYGEIIRGEVRSGYGSKTGVVMINFATHYLGWETVCKACILLQYHARNALRNLK